MAVQVSEFLASNSQGLQDLDGAASDWIELHNTGPAAVDLSGWGLSDDASLPGKWAFPNGVTLAAGGRLVVFASGKNLTGAELHTNFSLNAAGEDLVLSLPGGGVVDAYLNYPAQETDVSYGRAADRAATVAQTLVGPGSDAAVRPYTSATSSVAIDDFWREVGYDDAAWIQTKTGIGFDRDDNALDGAIFQELTTGQMNYPTHVGAYVRVPFTVENPAELTSLQLSLRYDDGYVAYLNGRELSRANIDEVYRNGFNFLLNARATRPDATVLSTPDVLDLTSWIERLLPGENVLSFYVATSTGTTDRNDLLLAPVLTATRATGEVNPRYQTIPTPGAENGAGWLGLVGDTSFSLDRGFYDAPISVAITTPTAGATIRYTTDGTAPTPTHGTVYTSPVAVSTTTTLRAAAFLAGYFPTDVDTQTYVFLDDVLAQDGVGLPAYTTWGAPADWDVDPGIVAARGAAQLKNDLKSLPTVSLTTQWADLFGDGVNQGIYTETLSWKYESDERPVSVEYFTADGSEGFHLDAAVEVQGNSSVRRWNTDKLSLQLKFKHPYGDGELESTTLFGNSAADPLGAVKDFDSLVLDAQYNYTWLHANVQQHAVAKYINDQVVSDYVNLAGGDSPHGRWVHLYLNGLYWGVYNLHERPDAGYAQELYGGAEEDYSVVKAFDGTAEHPNKVIYVDGGRTAEEDYLLLLDQADDNLANYAEYQQVEALLDVDSFITYMIAHYYAGNWDWGQDNWYATYNTVDPAGRWRFHAWDQEHAFPTADNLALGETLYDVNYDLTAKYLTVDQSQDDFGPTQLHFDLAQSPEYRLRFADHVQRLMRNNGLLTSAGAAGVFQARIDELASAIHGEAARWGDNRGAYDGDDWRANVDALATTFFPARTGIVLNQFTTRGWLSTLQSPTLGQYGGQVATGYDLTLANPNPAGTIYYTLDGSDPRLPGGGVAPTALAYTGPVDLLASTRLRARVLSAGVWSAEEDRTFVVEAPPALRIVELHYNPSTNQDHEFIELVNFGATPLSLDGVTIGGFATTPYAFPAGITLGAGQRIVVARTPSAFDALYGASVPRTATGYADANLSNGGELITLTDAFGVLLQSFAFDDVAPWPTAPDGGGYSLEYVGPMNMDPADVSVTVGDPYDNGANWRSSLTLGGTPGAPRTVAPLVAGDYDRSGEVDDLDYAVWGSQFGATGLTPFAGADGTGDGAVNLADYVVWRDNFGAAAPAALAAPRLLQAQTAVADPAGAPALVSDATHLAETPAATRDATPLLPWAPTPVGAPAKIAPLRVRQESDPGARALDLALALGSPQPCSWGGDRQATIAAPGFASDGGRGETDDVSPLDVALADWTGVWRRGGPGARAARIAGPPRAR